MTEIVIENRGKDYYRFCFYENVPEGVTNVTGYEEPSFSIMGNFKDLRRIIEIGASCIDDRFIEKSVSVVVIEHAKGVKTKPDYGKTNEHVV